MIARLAEDSAALALAEIGSRLELGFLDAQYRDGPLDPDAIRAALPRRRGSSRRPDSEGTRITWPRATPRWRPGCR